jgi:hypothetical protein
MDNNGQNEELEYLCSQDAYEIWLVENYHMLNCEQLETIKSNDLVKQSYIFAKGLPDDVEIK